MEPTNIPTVNPAPQGFNWKDYFSFKTMITLQIIQIIYIVGAIFITIAALMMMFSRGDSGYPGGPMAFFGGGGFFSGLIFLVVGNVALRVWCEIIIVFFRINKTLNNIETNTGR
jgi:NADH:ubiquinone oxidoreductase subunit 6 (subunit J)